MTSSAQLRARHSLLFYSIVMLTGCVAQVFMLATPAFVGLMGSEWHYSESQLGLIVTAEVAGSAIGTLLVSFVLARRSVRYTMLAGLLTMFVSNACMSIGPSAQAAVLIQLASGFGCGVISGVGIRYVALGPAAARLVSILTVTQSVFAMLLMTFVLPALGTPAHAYELVSAMVLACSPILMFLGGDEPIVDEVPAGGAAIRRGGAYLTLFSMFLVSIGVGVVWTFSEHLGKSASIPAATIAWLLGSGSMFGLLGCVAMPWLVEKGYRASGSAGALLLSGGAAAALAMPMHTALYIGGTLAFMIGWTGATIGQFATLPVFDPSGRLIPLSVGFNGAGYAVGAALGGYLIESSTISQSYLVAAGFCLLAALAFVAAHLVPRPATGTVRHA